MAFLRYFRDWLVAVFRAWIGWVSGSITAGLIELSQRLGWWSSPPPKIYWILVCIGLVFSTFGAWRAERLRSELHEAPEVMLDYRFEHSEGFSEQGSIMARNTGHGTARNIEVEIEDAVRRPSFSAISYLAQGDEKPVLQRCIIDGNNHGVGGISAGCHFLNYLRMLKDEVEEPYQIVFRFVTVYYKNEHGLGFAQDFRASYNVMNEESRMFPWGQKRLLK